MIVCEHWHKMITFEYRQILWFYKEEKKVIAMHFLKYKCFTCKKCIKMTEFWY